MTRKKVTAIHDAPQQHWVGDGFPVRSLFSYHGDAELLSPFLLLDYAAPTQFEPTRQPRGVGEHPHRGFETVTIIYDGEVAHRDSTGAGGTIGPGDVQWMTAGAGILHDEFHSPDFTRRGGSFEMVQLWVNLPAKDKLTAPRYQTLLAADIPQVELPHGAGTLRIIAGEHDGISGAAKTFTPLDVWDVRLNADARESFEFVPGRTLAFVVLSGELVVNGQSAKGAQLVVFDRDNDTVSVEAASDAKLVILSGEPIDEAVVGYGPFVMNTEAEIQQALRDFNGGRFGQLTG